VIEYPCATAHVGPDHFDIPGRLSPPIVDAFGSMRSISTSMAPPPCRVMCTPARIRRHVHVQQSQLRQDLDSVGIIAANAAAR
jgi:hypothetical protein